MHNWNKSTTPGEETSIPKYYQNLWMGWNRSWEEVDIFGCSVDDLFVDINYTTFDDKEELLEGLLSSREKFYLCKGIFLWNYSTQNSATIPHFRSKSI